MTPDKQRALEKRVIQIARTFSLGIPAGEIVMRSPDIPLDAEIHGAEAVFGVEVTELMPPSHSEFFNSLEHEYDFRNGVIRRTEKEYRASATRMV
jgi:hypothetical protein